ncbi:MFS transporter/fungal specific transcription factor domain-containing protein [Aspergillus clavatus NRRL 1]|uniref:MFS transporter, putative n=1 Tax=Aspergillus clavatus (strain ATCC 1007 / CBS 513.65 / DSM 816 / NCTC 3887 / NRRL 1 / QM 1276 / 107) TaxID=344612 RepID=A1CCL8_ASPCL|nr:MFS transporter, putative [Aspergillus clavatus NRRL 1]EAW12275.1 MFS transporter, putative [Aspergillus clavatus NRRL 1]
MAAQPGSEERVTASEASGQTTLSIDLEKSGNGSRDVVLEEDTRPGAKAGLPLSQFWIVMLGLNIGMLLTALDFNIVATAVPIISSEFNAYNNSSWLGTGFLITFALVLPLYSKLGDIFGQRNMFIVGTLIFTLGSGLCGGSKSMNMLIWSRVIQGIGGGGIYGLVNVIITNLVPLRDIGKYISFTGLVWAIADVAGPLLGGAFSQYVTWRWCFYINLCISPISLIITLFFLRLPTPKVDKERIKNFDILGSITLIGGTICLLLAISWGGNNFPWNDGRVIGCFVGGLVLLGLFMVWEHWAKDPLMPPVFLQSRALVAIFFAEFFYGANLLGMMYYVPQYFQLVYGDSATMSGVALLPMMLGLAVGNPIAGWVTSKYGLTLANAWVGSALTVLISGLITRWNPGTSRAEAVIELIIIGIGQGAVMEGLLVGSQFLVHHLLRFPAGPLPAAFGDKSGRVRPSPQNLSTRPPSPMLSPEEIIQLTADFFERSHPKFPCIHKETFLERLRGPGGPVVSTPLEWAILATAARAHRDMTISTRADMFLQIAVDSLAQSPLLRENFLRDLQAAIWCVFSLYYSGEMTKVVVLLAQAYSLACLNGLNKLDDPNPSIPATMRFSPLEEEECRGTLWALFVLDRHMNYLMGRHFVMDDIQWCVNYPLDDRSLQHGLRPEPEPYSRDLAALASETANIPIGVSLPRLVCKASVMLGRIVTYKSINPMPTEAQGIQNRLAVFHELQSALACFWVSLPACVHNVAEVPSENVDQSVWLLITLHTCSTLLFYMPEVEHRSPGSARLPSERENFVCSYKSVDKVVAVLRQISGLVIDAVSNPMLASSYFMCCRFILAQWRLTQQQSYRLDLNLILKLLARMAEKGAQMPRIYKDIIDQELGRDMQIGVNVSRILMRTDYCFMI